MAMAVTKPIQTPRALSPEIDSWLDRAVEISTIARHYEYLKILKAEADFFLFHSHSWIAAVNTVLCGKGNSYGERLIILYF